MSSLDRAPHIELRYFADCPHVEMARGLLRDCLASLGVDLPIEELQGDYPSPTVLIDGVDVTGTSITSGRACRLDLPTRAQVMAALRRGH